MIIAKLEGGLGNQMFQYAFAYSLSKRLETEVIIDDAWFKNQSLRRLDLARFNLKIKKLTPSQRFFNKIRGVPTLKERQFDWYDIDAELSNPIITSGYWQSFVYFDKFRADLVQMFEPREEPSPENRTLAKQLLSTDSTAIHIRRGDYVSNPAAAKFHGILPVDHYCQALEKLAFNKEKTLYVFTDDERWARSTLQCMYPNLKIIVQNNHEGMHHWDLWLMRKCKNLVIANSSFSWWAAYLKVDNGSIIAPSRWFSERIIKRDTFFPKNWHVL